MSRVKAKLVLVYFCSSIGTVLSRLLCNMFYYLKF